MKKFLLLLSILFCFYSLKAEMVFDTLLLKASLSYKPTKQTNDVRTFSSLRTFKIPAELIVTQGNAGNNLAVIEFEGDKQKVTVTYRGNFNGTKYSFSHSTGNKYSVGDLIEANKITLQIKSGDEKSGTTVVIAPVVLGYSITYNVKRCSGGGQTIFTTCISGQTPSQVKWNNTYIGTTFTSATCGIQSEIVVPSDIAPNYSLLVTFTDGTTHSATVTTSSTTTSPANPVLSATPNPICSGQTVSLKANAATATTFTWTGANLNATVGTTVTANPVSTNTYKAIATWTVNKCTSFSTINVNVIKAQVIASATQVCPGEVVNLSLASAAPTGSTYQWYDQTNTAIPGETNPTYSYTASSPGSYYLVISNGGANCTSNTIGISIKPASCCAPAGATIISAGNLGVAGTIQTIDAGGGTVVFNGTYNVSGNLRLINGTFRMLPGTIINIDGASGGLPSPYYGMPAAYIHVEDATLILKGATLRAANPATRWTGVFIQRSTIRTEASCTGARSLIRDAYFAVTLIPDNGSLYSNAVSSNFDITETEFTDNQYMGIYSAGVLGQSSVSYSSFISGTTFHSIVVGSADIGGLNIHHNYFERGMAAQIAGNGAVFEHNECVTMMVGVNSHSTNQPHIIRNNRISLSNFSSGNAGWGINVHGGSANINDNIITGTNYTNQRGINLTSNSGTTYSGPSSTITNNRIENAVRGITLRGPASAQLFTDNTLIDNNSNIVVHPNPFVPPYATDVRCNTFNNSGLGGTSYGIFVEENAFLNDLGTTTSPNGNAFIGFTGTKFPMEYNGTDYLTFKYYRSASPQENIQATNSATIIAGAVQPTPGYTANCFGPPGVISGFKLAASALISEEDSVNAVMDSLRYQLGSFRKMKTWQGEILNYFEKTNNIDGLYSYCDSLKGCNLEAYNTFMLYLMNKYDHSDQCSKAHQCADEVLNANPDDKEIQARTTYFNYECRQTHAGHRAFILPFMPMNLQDSTDLYSVANSETSLSEIACMKLRMHNPHISCNTENTYKPDYPDCGPECDRKRKQFLKKGWEKETGFKADKIGGQLSQNIPNPASDETIIPYLIPSDENTSIESAYIVIQSVINGSEVRRIDLTEAGYNYVTVSLDGLRPGVYTYSLIIDGIKQDVKRMIVVK
jgi:hypothetical protein